MRKLLILLLTFISFNSNSQEADLPALRLSDNFSKPYRVLNTTISDKSLFKQYWRNST